MMKDMMMKDEEKKAKKKEKDTTDTSEIGDIGDMETEGDTYEEKTPEGEKEAASDIDNKTIDELRMLIKMAQERLDMLCKGQASEGETE